MREAGPTDAGGMAQIHEQAFDHPWSNDSFEALLNEPGAGALIAGQEGFILWRTAAGEAEILTLAVVPAVRRRGLARALLIEACKRARNDGAEAMFLEVSDQNAAAVALYDSAGFARAGLRRGYYASLSPAQDALVMRLALTASPSPPITAS
jgi:ribosomal-protein-alanine N-acetyltransferase